MGEFVADVFRQNEWANLTLIDACRVLMPGQLDAKKVGTYGSIRETLVHLVSAEVRYVRRLGGTPIIEFVGDQPWPGFDVLEEVVHSSAAGLLERARRVAGLRMKMTEIAEDAPDRPYLVDATVVLVQALNHSTEHRGQICTVMTALGVPPPEIDGWTWGKADKRTLPLD